MRKYLWIGLVLVAGCKTKSNGKYCDTTCGDPTQICDQIKHECVPANSDLSMEMHVDDLSMSMNDLSGADLTTRDLTPPPACTVSATCPDGFPVCDSTSLTCRLCSGASEDSVCTARSSATPHCKLSGTNMGLCEACNVNADCPTATPTCNPDGTCRKCAAHTDCDSEICDLSGGATNGQCVPESNVVYVNSANDPGQSSCSEATKDGSKAHPYCLIATALTLVGVMPTVKTHVHLDGSANNYDGFEITGTASTLTFVGPGKDAMPPAMVQSTNAGVSSVLIDPSGSASVVLDGITVIANGNGRSVDCNGSGANPDLKIVNCSITNAMKSALFADKCNVNVSESYLSKSAYGISLGSSSNYSVQNCFIFGNSTGVSFPGSLITGVFNFNTVAYNTTTTGIDCGNSTSAVLLTDSIVFGNKSSGGTQFTNGSHCTLIRVVTGPDNIGGGQIVNSPVLVSTTDLHLKIDDGASLASNQMCCIDQTAASPSPTPSPLPTVDIDGTKRPKGAAWDYGAHEAM